MKFKQWWSIYGGAVIVCGIALAIIFALVALAIIIGMQFGIIATETTGNSRIGEAIFILVAIFLSAAFILFFFIVLGQILSRD